MRTPLAISYIRFIRYYYIQISIRITWYEILTIKCTLHTKTTFYDYFYYIFMLINLKQAEDIWKSSFLQYDVDTWLTVGNNCLIKINCSCQNFLRWLWRSLDKNGLLPIKTCARQSRDAMKWKQTAFIDE